MKNGVRFWGRVQAVKPRLVLTKFGGETGVKCHGHLLVIQGTRTPEDGTAEETTLTVAIGLATQDKRQIAVGDLVRGDALPVPDETHDTPADLYRVGTFRTIAPAGPAAAPPDPPRSDAPLTPTDAEAAPRRALHPDNLADGGPCAPCPYGVIVPVVRLSDPRDYRGIWRQVPACLGPDDCPHFRAFNA